MARQAVTALLRLFFISDSLETVAFQGRVVSVTSLLGRMPSKRPLASRYLFNADWSGGDVILGCHIGGWRTLAKAR